MIESSTHIDILLDGLCHLRIILGATRQDIGDGVGRSGIERAGARLGPVQRFAAAITEANAAESAAVTDADSPR